MPTMTQAGYTPPQKSAPTRANPPGKPKKPKKNRKQKKGIGAAGIVSLVIFLIAVLIGSCALFLYAQTAPYSDTFLPGTTVSGYALGGLTAQEGAAALAMLTDDAVDAWRYTLTWGDQTYTLDSAAISLSVDVAATLDPLWQIGRDGNMLTRYLAMLSLRGDGRAEKPVLTYDMDAVDAFLSDIKAQVDRASVDATVTYVQGNSEPFRFTDEQTGLELETDAIRARMEAAILSLSPGTEALQPKEISPNVYRAELENATVLRARVVMPLSGSAAAQENAALAAAQFQNVRLEAGERLSFNQTVGLRTDESGYVQAEEPAYGQDIYGIGGGVCQVSTALYRLALLGGLEVAERSAAVYPVPYCEAGQEAAVSDQGLDLVFVNNTQTPLFLTARVYGTDDGQTMELQLIGQPTDGRFALESEIETIDAPDEPVYVRDSEGRYATYTDERIPVGEAMPGCRATVKRVNESTGQTEIISEDTYDAAAQIVYVGVQRRD